ncbi:protein of unknown function [Methylocaldum szegediense]|uniref:Uncharacterized protein n=1 Tax=Methylocaldum szegediense TaxID=73780 RepID=A0ABM9HXK3_9GAMM|nr:protein of unknown function [Methylocaldum szegediense]
MSERALAKKHGISETTVRKWKRRHSIEDASHRPRTLHTTLQPPRKASSSISASPSTCPWTSS